MSPLEVQQISSWNFSCRNSYDRKVVLCPEVQLKSGSLHLCAMDLRDVVTVACDIPAINIWICVWL